ncbi:hypothetical protein [Yoonia sp. I 8.24]|uniref:hypothetical protein n=1 Tax=Yoonia sp. I 8.24 TaxID=1537229 RepID=UPI001EDCB258|nr:hypothetical protein [Yoonia sp. I 8.24]MCG3266280.1 hypothetical protein [Yoonia sp. I 8.24]
MDIDWLTASEEERKRLYTVTRDVGKVVNMSVEQVMDAALGRTAPIGTDYVANFRKGKIRRSFAKLIYEWIAEQHADLGRKHEERWFLQSNTDAWDHYVEEHGIRGQLQIKRFTKDELNLIKKVKDRAAPDATLKLGEEFCFFLRADANVHAIGFERYKAKWHVMPLGVNGSLTFQLQSDELHFPIDASGVIERLTEESDLDLHRFAFVIAQSANDLPRKSDIKDIGQDAELHYIDVLFSA